MGAPYVHTQLGSQLRTGCNNRIAWASRSGAIAHVAQKSVVHITNLVCLDGESWGFSEPLKIYPTDPNNNPATVTNLSWNHSGSDLAVADEHGTLSIYTASPTELGTMTRLFQSSTPSVANPAEMNRIIGFKWFGHDVPVPIINPPIIQNHIQNFISSLDRSKLGGSTHIAEFSTFNMPTPGPHVPGNKQSCIAFTRRGNIRLFTQGVSDAKYYEVSCSADRDGITREAVIFSHASFANCNDNTVILAAYSTETESIYVYRLQIEWPALSVATGLKSPARTGSNHISTLRVQRLLRQKLIPAVNPSLTVSHIHLMPAGSYNPQSAAEVELRVAFTNKNSTIVQKYYLAKRKLPLLKSFLSLSNRTDYINSPGNLTESETIALVPADDALSYPKLAVSIGSTNFDTIFHVSFADGTTDLKFRQQYSKIPYTSASMQTISNSGFLFFELPEPAIDICLSHNTCSALYLTPDNELRISYARNRQILSPSKQPDNPVEKNLFMILSAVTLAARHAMASIHYYTDDLYVVMKLVQQDLARISPKLASEFLHVLILESYRAINVPLDSEASAKEIQKDLFSPSLGKVFTLQAIMGTSKGWKRTPMARIGWATLSTRVVFIAFYISYQKLGQVMKFQQQKRQQSGTNFDVNDFEERAKILESTLSLVRYTVDLIALISQELYLATLEPMNKYYDFFANRNSIAISLLLARIPRAFLMFSLRVMRTIEQQAAKIAEEGSKAQDSLAQRTNKQMVELIQTHSPVNLSYFEMILYDIEQKMEKLGPNIKHKLLVEDSLLISVSPPPELSGMVSRTVEHFSKLEKSAANAPWLFYYDVSWLGLNDEYDDDRHVKNGSEGGESGDKADAAGADGIAEPAAASSNNNNNSANAFQNALKTQCDFDGSKKIKPIHPHIKDHCNGTETDFVLKRQMSPLLPPQNSGMVRARCGRCGELTTWRGARGGQLQTWDFSYTKACPCGGTWIPADY